MSLGRCILWSCIIHSHRQLFLSQWLGYLWVSCWSSCLLNTLTSWDQLSSVELCHWWRLCWTIRISSAHIRSHYWSRWLSIWFKISKFTRCLISSRTWSFMFCLWFPFFQFWSRSHYACSMIDCSRENIMPINVIRRII